ncbi:AmmeMemoRadiSam system radical SAM enzyme [Candidatus Latescibacterota bacterium]
MNRRTFLATGTYMPVALLAGFWTPQSLSAQENVAAVTGLFEARYYEKLDSGRVQCHVCPTNCVIPAGGRGFCSTRENRGGTLYSLVYGKIAAEHIDPIEKKPFYHVLPGSQAYSIATAGCNMTCKFCQNWQLSQSRPEELHARSVSPGEIAEAAQRNGALTIAYTYNEPTVFTEFVEDCAKAGNRLGVRSVVVSNGYISAEPLERLADVITAYKVDFKAFSEVFYRDITGGRHDDVLATIKRLRARGIWTELVHLTIPTLNDRDEDFEGMGDWLMGEVGPEVPVHFTRFHPMYRLTNLPVTPVSTLERARAILLDKGMLFVYVGNVPGHPANSTYCPSCGAEVISRMGFSVDAVYLRDGACAKCGTPIPGIWS